MDSSEVTSKAVGMMRSGKRDCRLESWDRDEGRAVANTTWLR